MAGKKPDDGTTEDPAIEDPDVSTVEAVNRDKELDDTGKPAEAELLKGTNQGVGPEDGASQAGAPNNKGTKVAVFNEATPDNAVAAREKQARPELPEFDPNQIPDHENRIEIGRAQQAALREIHFKQAAASDIQPEVVKS